MKEKMSGRGVFGRAKEPGRRGGGKLQAVLVPHRPQSKVNFIRGRGALGVCYPGQVQLRRGLGGKLLIATTRGPRPLAPSPPAKGRDARSVGGSGAAAGDQRHRSGGRIQGDSAMWLPRNRQVLPRKTLGLVVLISSRRRRELSDKAALRGDGELHFPEGRDMLGSPGKRPGWRHLLGTIGPVPGARACRGGLRGSS